MDRPDIRRFEAHVPQIGERVYIDPTAVIIGQVEIGADSSLWPHVVARGDVNRIVIGARTNVQDLTMLHVTHEGPYSPDGFALHIGDDVTVGHKATLHGCTVGDRCLIGMAAVIMDGAIIEDEVVIAAGSVVSPGKRLSTGQLYRGAPARPVRPLREAEREMLRYSADHYVRLKDRYLGRG